MLYDTRPAGQDRATSAATFAAGLAHLEAGRREDARALFRAVLADDPRHVESLHLLGLLTAQDGDAETGAGMIRQAMALAPGRAPHHNSLALAWRKLGRDADAVAEYRLAAALRPGSAEILNNLAATLRDLGLHEEAVARYRDALDLAPGIAEIWANLAGTLVEQQAPRDVEACFRRAIELRPDFAAALANYGRWLTAQARWADAEARLNEAVRLAPADPLAWNNLGVVRQELGHDAEACYRRALALDPGFADAHYNLGCLLSADGRADAALACHQAAIAADPLHGAARLAACITHLPILYLSEAEIGDRRARYRAALDHLAAAAHEPGVARAVAGAIGNSQPFFLPYQQENDRDPQRVYGQLACRLLAGTERPLAPPPRPGERVRLGIVSGFFNDHTIFKLFLEGWLSELDRARFEVIAFHTGPTSDARTERARRLADRFVQGPRSKDAWSRAVADAAPHVLLYPEVGMDPVAGHLAAQRLAPVQCVTWGHPETTGMPTIDLFLSSELMEPPGGDDHYTERLVRLPRLALHYSPDETAIPTLDRAALGLDPDAPVYWSGQALYKYLPRHDAVFPRIAAAVGRCQFVFIGFAKSAAVTAAFNERLARAFAAFGLDASQYCVMLPPMPQAGFLATVGLADVVLDTLGWSGGRSTLDCLARNPAIVTLPGRFMRGRHTAAILRQIGCEETIADSLEDYVAKAARLGLDPAWRAQIRQAMARNKHRAYRDTGYVRALELLLMEALAGS